MPQRATFALPHDCPDGQHPPRTFHMPSTALLFPRPVLHVPTPAPGVSQSHNQQSFNNASNSFNNNTTLIYLTLGTRDLLDACNWLYAEHLRVTCDEVWSPGSEGQQRRGLRSIYGRMFAVEPKPMREEDDEVPAVATGPGDPSRKTRTPILTLVAQHPRLAILGPPGGGKSTVLRHLALSRAVASDESLRNPVPTDADADAEVDADADANAPGESAASDEAAALAQAEADAWGQLNAFVPVWMELRTMTPPMPAQARKPEPAALPWMLDLHLSALRETLQKRASQIVPGNAEALAANQRAIARIDSELRQAYREGRILFLLDGLDEMTVTSRGTLATLHEGIRQLATAVPPGATHAPPNRLVVTCRERTWFDGWAMTDWTTQRGLKGHVSTLDGFSPDDRRAFLHAWFGPDMGNVANDVARHLEQPPRDPLGRLARMASVPLNLTMIAWLVERRARRARESGAGDGAAVADDGSLLPPSRAAIYEQVVDAILWEIDDKKDFGSQGERTLVGLIGDAPGHRSAFVACLAGAAFERLKTKDAPEWSETDLVEPIARRVADASGVCMEDARPDAFAVLRTLQCRAGILRLEKEGEGGQRRYRFVHRSFLEFFVALHLVRPAAGLGDDFEVRARDFLQGRSRLKDTEVTRERTWEPLRLAAGYLSVPEAEQRTLLTPKAPRDPNPVARLVRDLCPAIMPPPNPYDVWLAGELAIEAGIPRDHVHLPLRPALFDVMTRREGLTEPSRAAVGRVLGQLGDPRPGVDPGMPGRGRKQFFKWSEEIRPGTFVMGGDPYAWVGFETGFETGVDPVPRKIPSAYRIARYPVTNAQYDCFENSPYFRENASKQGWRKRDRSNAGFLSPNQPVVNVDWRHAMGFCKWVNSLDLSAKELGLPESCGWDGWTVCLPSEAEWELAARGPEERWLPWLSRTARNKTAPKAEKQSSQGYCNWYGSQVNATSPVGMYPNGASWCGAEDMIGNVWEWTRTRWRKFPDRSEDADIRDEDGSGMRVLRGGSWGFGVPESLRCATRFGLGPGRSIHDFGFRVAVVCLSACGG